MISRGLRIARLVASRMDHDLVFFITIFMFTDEHRNGAINSAFFLHDFTCVR